ncbi:MAG TPA: class I SAM-dependent methyltransferase [Alphaproteobacteria bacterium]|nr:class I SAM-dependent methyltransferase [Alphaproteobacteria bacterium]
MSQYRYRERIYRHYVEAARQDLAPATLDGLTPRLPYLTRLVARHFPPARDATILDLGCGHGALLHVARKAGYTNLLGIDNSPAQIAAAKRLGIAGVEQGDLLQAIKGLSSASRDAIIAFDVIEHLTKDELIDLTDEVLRVLKPGGRWIIHVPNGVSLFAGASRYDDLTHELAFTCESLTQLTMASGFRSAAFFEDEPVAHGLKSAVRLVLWKMIRALLRFYLTVETGAAQPVLTQNMLAVAIK